MFKTMITSVTPIVAAAALLCNTLLYCGAAQAQEIYPNKPIKIVLGVAPGASTDFLAREVGRGLSERVKVPVVIEYKAGPIRLLVQTRSPSRRPMATRCISQRSQRQLTPLSIQTCRSILKRI